PCLPLPAHRGRRTRPPTPWEQRRPRGGNSLTGRNEPTPNPSSDWHGHRISHQFPALPGFPVATRPSGAQALQTLPDLNDRSTNGASYRSVRYTSPGRRGDFEIRPTLEGWRDSITPSNPAVALGPIDAVSAVLPSRRRHPSLISKQHASRVLCPRGDQEDPSATVPDAEVLGINGPVRQR